jgi:hypothetical protein
VSRIIVSNPEEDWLTEVRCGWCKQSIMMPTTQAYAGAFDDPPPEFPTEMSPEQRARLAAVHLPGCAALVPPQPHLRVVRSEDDR